MRSQSVVGVVAVTVLAGVASLLIAGCYGIPKGTMQEVALGNVKLAASGAGIIKADAQKTTFRIKCRVCGYETEEITIDTPAAGKPYAYGFKCPKCGHKQTVVIRSAG